MVWWAIPLLFIAAMGVFVGWMHIALHIVNVVEKRWRRIPEPVLVFLATTLVLLPLVILVSWLGSHWFQ